MSQSAKEVCILISEVQTQMKLIKTLNFNVWQAVTWNEKEDDGMVVIAEERALQEHGARPYVRLVERLLNDGWEPISGMPREGTFIRNK